MENYVKYKCKYMDITKGDTKGILSSKSDRYFVVRHLLPVPAFFRLTVQ